MGLATAVLEREHKALASTRRAEERILMIMCSKRGIADGPGMEGGGGK